MPSTTLLRLRRRIADAFEDEVQALQAAPASPESVHEIEVLVRECLNHAREFRPMWQAVWESLDTDEDVDFEALGHELQGIFERGSHVLRSMKTVCQQYQESGLPIPSAGDLDRALTDLEALSTSIFKNWPWADTPLPPMDPQLRAEIQADIERGDFVTIEEILRELQAPGSSAD